MRKKLGDIARDITRSVGDEAKSQLRLLSDVQALASARDDAVRSRYEALLDEHSDQPEYVGRLRKAVVAKLEAERGADRRRAEQRLRAQETDGDGEAAGWLAQHLENTMESARETRIRKLERLLNWTDDEQASTPRRGLRSLRRPVTARRFVPVAEVRARKITGLDSSGAEPSKRGKSKSEKAKSGEAKSGETKSGKAKSGETKSGETKSGKAKSGKAKSGKVKSGKAKAGKAGRWQTPTKPRASEAFEAVRKVR